MNPFEQLISAGNLPNVYAAAILPTAKGSGSGSRGEKCWEATVAPCWNTDSELKALSPNDSVDEYPTSYRVRESNTPVQRKAC